MHNAPTRTLSKKEIIPNNFFLQNLTINVESLCSCPCEFEPNSENCNFNGNLTCGKCICNQGFSGTDCGCDKNSAESAMYVTSKYFFELQDIFPKRNSFKNFLITVPIVKTKIQTIQI